MTYIVERSARVCVVTYDGLDPLNGREPRRWIPIVHERSEAEPPPPASIANASLARDPTVAPSRSTSSSRGRGCRRSDGEFALPTAYRYAWFIARYIMPPSVRFLCADSGAITPSIRPERGREGDVDQCCGSRDRIAVRSCGHVTVEAVVRAC